MIGLHQRNRLVFLESPSWPEGDVHSARKGHKKRTRAFTQVLCIQQNSGGRIRTSDLRVMGQDRQNATIPYLDDTYEDGVILKGGRLRQIVTYCGVPASVGQASSVSHSIGSERERRATYRSSNASYTSPAPPNAESPSATWTPIMGDHSAMGSVEYLYPTPSEFPSINGDMRLFLWTIGSRCVYLLCCSEMFASERRISGPEDQRL